MDRGRRAGNYQDMCDYIKLVHRLNVIHQEGGGPLEPTDLPVETRHLDMYRMLATLLDKTWQCLAFGRTVVEDALEDGVEPAGADVLGLLVDAHRDLRDLRDRVGGDVEVDAVGAEPDADYGELEPALRDALTVGRAIEAQKSV